jgi:hypothetical protein
MGKKGAILGIAFIVFLFLISMNVFNMPGTTTTRVVTYPQTTVTGRPLSLTFTAASATVMWATPNGKLFFLWLSGSSYGMNLAGTNFTEYADANGIFTFTFSGDAFSFGAQLKVTDVSSGQSATAVFNGNFGPKQ